jgi:hypothetical protein
MKYFYILNFTNLKFHKIGLVAAGNSIYYWLNDNSKLYLNSSFWAPG